MYNLFQCTITADLFEVLCYVINDNGKNAIKDKMTHWIHYMINEALSSGMLTVVYELHGYCNSLGPKNCT